MDNNIDTLIEKLTDLSEKQSVTNERLGVVVEEIKLHGKLLYGDTPDGGIISRTNQIRTVLDRHEETLDKLNEQCNKVVQSMTSQVEISRLQSVSITNMNKVLFSLAGVVVLMLILSGILGWREIYALLQALGT